MNKRAWIKATVFICISAVLFTVWGIAFVNTNNRVRYKPINEYYALGEAVDIGPNYFDTITENPDGYIIQVNSATLRDYTEYVESLGGKVDEEYYAMMGVEVPKYVYDVEVTLTNTDNTDGLIYLNRYELQSGALTLPVDYTIWNLLSPQLEGSQVFRLQPGTEEIIHFPFAEQPMNSMVDSEKTNEMIENNEFYLCVSYCPVRKLISLGNAVHAE